jgi:excisionase family DNA binding protein
MPISKKKSMRKAASPAAKKAAPAHHDTRPHLSAAGRKKISSTNKRLIKELPIRQRMENKRAREEEMAAELSLTNEGPWLTLRQIAKRLGFSEITVRRWAQTGGLRYRRFSKTIKVPLWELERFSGGRSNAA